jgi:hypothetical protein
MAMKIARNTQKDERDAAEGPYTEVRRSQRALVTHDYAALSKGTAACSPATKPMLHAGRGMCALWTFPVTVGVTDEE